MRKRLVISCLFVATFLQAFGWSEHPMLARPALAGLGLWDEIGPTEVKHLTTFLLETENRLEPFLASHEHWARTHLPHYQPRPDDLAFRAGGDTTDIVLRFLQAIRVNPGMQMPLYLHPLPGQTIGNHPHPGPQVITPGRNTEFIHLPIHIQLREGEKIPPLDVLVTANEEPDYGFDLGLFTDNQNDYGTRYGFGEQPFGNPNLAYSSQAPFHMAFYHEAGIVYRFAPELNRTFLDYRVHLFRELSVFAFSNDQHYWGWRFLGWSMHYAGDITMPYHSKPLPGYSTSRMLWINLKAMLGFPRNVEDAVQLVSNRHTAMEAYQQQELRRAYLTNNFTHPFFQALALPEFPVPYFQNFIRTYASYGAASQSTHTDALLAKHLPEYMVSDPSVEVSEMPQLKNLARLVHAEQGGESAEALNAMIAERLSAYSMSIRALLISVARETGMGTQHH
ncbi:MAG: hypothetical protein ACLFS0_01740 [Bacteroidales bacterium]